MAIQFSCPACRQPIEIDDEYARQSVTCPYCRKVVTAPDQNAPHVTPDAAARPAGAPPLPYTPAAPFGAVPPPPASNNWFATVGLVCALLLILSYCVLVGVVMRSIGPIDPNMTQQQVQKKLMESSTTIPAVALMGLLTVALSLGGTVFSILGLVKRQGRRWQAIVGVTICGLMLALNCLGMFMQGFAAGAAGS